MEQGCGKTLTAIAVIGRGFLDGHIQRALIIAPLSVVPVWQQEFAEYADFPFEVRILSGKQKNKEKVFTNPWPKNVCQIIIVNYELVWRMIPKKNKRWRYDQSIFAKQWPPDIVVADESQRIKSVSAQQSKGLHLLGANVPYRMILTGTPVTGSPLDFFSQYKFLDRRVFGDSFALFRNRYAITETKSFGGNKFQAVIGFQNKDELVRKAHSIAYRVTKEEALDLPEQVDQKLFCTLEPEANTYYQEMLRNQITEIENAGEVVAQNVLTKLLRLQQMTGGFVTQDDGTIQQVSKAKMNLLSETLDDLLFADKKVVIFARFIPEITAICRQLDKLIGADAYRFIVGEIPTAERGIAVKEFQNDPKIKVFIAQIQTAGLGITLTAADTDIFYSSDFSYANHDQCKARLHRIGQKNNVTHIHLLARGTIDEKVYDVLQNKKDIARDVVDNWRQYFI